MTAMRRSGVLAMLVAGLVACGGKPAPVQPGMGTQTEAAPAPALDEAGQAGDPEAAERHGAEPAGGAAAPMMAPPPPPPAAAKSSASPASPAKKTRSAPKGDKVRTDPCEGGE
jgi:hypothetical protein